MTHVQKPLKESKMDSVITYLRDKRGMEKDPKTGKRVKGGTPFAVLIAVQIDDKKASIGYALCSKHDNFSKDKGKQLATEKAKFFLNKRTPQNIPHTIKKELPAFIERSMKYFQDKQFPSWTHDLLVTPEVAQ